MLVIRLKASVACCKLQLPAACCCLWPAPRHNKVQHTDSKGQPTGTRVVRMEWNGRNGMKWSGWPGQDLSTGESRRHRKQMGNEPSAAVVRELYSGRTIKEIAANKLQEVVQLAGLVLCIHGLVPRGVLWCPAVPAHLSPNFRTEWTDWLLGIWMANRKNFAKSFLPTDLLTDCQRLIIVLRWVRLAWKLGRFDFVLHLV